MAITISGENNNDRITAQDGVIDTISGFNIAGIITASSFTGDLTGNVTGNLSGNVTGNINNTTLLLQTGGSERVRIDSNGRIGLGIANPGDYFSSYNRVVMGRTNDTGGMTIVSSTTSGGYISFADGTSGNQAYRGMITYAHGDDSMRFNTAATEMLRIDSSGGIILKRASLAKIITDATDKAIYIAGGDDTIVGGNINLFGSTHASHANHLRFRSGSTVAMEIDENGAVDIAKDLDVDGHTNLDNVSIAGVTTITDDKKLYLGNDQDLELYYQTTGVAGAYVQTGSASGNLTIRNADAGQYVYIHGDHVHLRSTTGNEAYLQAQRNGAVSLYYDNVKRFETTSTGVTVTSNVRIPDGGKYFLGTGDDMYLNHSGSHGAIHNASGNLYISTQHHIYLSTSLNESAITANANGSVELYHNNVKKFETTANGADFTVASGGQVNIFGLGSTNGLRISGPQSASSAFLFFNTNHQNVSGGTDQYTIQCGGANHTLMFKHGDSTGNVVFELDDTEHVRIPQDGKALKIGAGQDLQLVHDGTDSFIKNNTGQLILRVASVESAVVCEPNGAVKLYHDNTERFETSNTGVNLSNHSYSVISGAMGSTENIKIANTTSGGYIQIGLQQQDSDGLHHRGYIKASKGSASIAGKLELLARGSGGGTNRGWIIDAAVGIQANQQVLPESDNTYDLGSSTKRWNDLYLSGGLRVGGTGTSNELDDYEEGLWTPGITYASGTTVAGSNNYGYYVKIGCLVHLSATIHWTSMNSSPTASYARITGIPFPYKNASAYRSSALLGAQLVGLDGGTSGNIVFGVGSDANNSFIYITPVNLADNSGGNYSHYPTIKTSGTIFGFKIEYMTDS